MRIKYNLWRLQQSLIKIWTSLNLERINYRDAYSLNFDVSLPSQAAIQSAKDIRGKNRRPAFMVYGVAPRAGTNYIGDLLSNHPEICAYPNKIYEVPFLCMTDKLKSFQASYFRDYDRNIDYMNKNDFLPLFGSSFISHLYSFAPEDKIILTKEPDTRFLRYFPVVFPHENLLLVLRDGRDVVQSTVASWPNSNFKKICQRWHDSTILMLEFQKRYKDKHLLIKYEDMLEDPRKNITEILHHYNLDTSTYPFDAVDTMPIIGSSTASKVDGKVNWIPVKSDKQFKPTKKWLTWTNKQKKIFKNIAGESLISSGYTDDMNW